MKPPKLKNLNCQKLTSKKLTTVKKICQKTHGRGGDLPFLVMHSQQPTIEKINPIPKNHSTTTKDKSKITSGHFLDDVKVNSCLKNTFQNNL